MQGKKKSFFSPARFCSKSWSMMIYLMYLVYILDEKRFYLQIRHAVLFFTPLLPNYTNYLYPHTQVGRVTSKCHGFSQCQRIEPKKRRGKKKKRATKIDRKETLKSTNFLIVFSGSSLCVPVILLRYYVCAQYISRNEPRKAVLSFHPHLVP